MQPPRRLLAAASLALAFALAATAHANREDARHHFEEGTKAYDLGQFERAADEYKEAYSARPDPIFLYNIAQSYRLAKRPTDAIFFYRRFLQKMPSAPNREAIEARVQEMETQLAAEKASVAGEPHGVEEPRHTEPNAAVQQEPAPTATANAAPVAATQQQPPPSLVAAPSEPAPVAATPVYRRGWFWGVVAGVAVVAVGAGVAGGVAASQPSPPMTHFGVTQVAF